MKLLPSLKKLIHVLRADLSLARLGGPIGWFTGLYYEGRIAQRRREDPAVRNVSFQIYGRPVALKLSSIYGTAFEGVFLDHEYQCAEHLPNSPRRILDLGANIGMGAVYLHAQFPGAKFICVEPDERNIPLLKSNLEGNKIDGKVVHAAAGARAGILKLRFGLDPTCSALETSPMHDLEEYAEVEVKTVEAILDEAGWASVDLLKMDIEGIEDEVLSAGNAWLNRVSSLILEIHPNTTPERISAYLKPSGFHLSRIPWAVEPVYLAVRKKEC